MGCGGSKAAGAFGATLTKDPSDFSIPAFKLGKVKVEEFDSFFDKVEEAANHIIDMSNTVNDLATSIKDECATLMNAYKVKITVDVPSTDRVILALAKADGSAVVAAEVEALSKDAAAKAADEAITKALAALHAGIASAPAPVTVGPTGALEGGNTAHVAALNEAIGKLVAAAPGYTIVACVKTSAAPGAPTFLATLEKPVFASIDDENPTTAPVSLLDIYKAPTAKDITGVLGLTADQASAVAAAGKNVSSASLAVKGKKLVPTASGDEDKVAAYKKAVNSANIATFKLFTACAVVHGDVNIPKALEAILVSLARKIKKMGADVTKLRVVPVLKVDEDGAIDFKVDIKHPDVPNLSFPEILPGPARHTYHTVLKAVDTVKAMIPKFAESKEKFEALIEESKTALANPTEALQKADLDLMAMGKAISVITRNAATILGAPTIFTTFTMTLKRLADEFKLTAEKIPTIDVAVLIA